MPDWAREIRARLAPLGLSPERESEIADELAQHLDDRYADLRAHGASDADAIRAVRADLEREPLTRALAAERAESDGDRRQPGTPAAGSMLGALWRDVRYGARSLRKAPGFTTVAAITLALGIGATTAMFSVLDAVLLRPLPFPAPEQLVRVFNSYGTSGNRQSLSVADFLALRSDSRVFSSIASFRLPDDGFSYFAGDRAERVFGTIVSSGFFTTLGVQPMLGRAFQEGDDAAGAPPTAVLGYAFWKRLGGDPAIVGTSINLQGKPTTVIGVMPASVWYPRGDQSELWLSDNFAPPPRRGPFGLAAIGRLRPDVSAAEQRASFAQLAAGVRAQFPGGPDRWTYIEQSVAERFSGPLRPVLLMLMGAVVLVLLIACVNVTNLMLARATGREPEIAVRTALGASRRALIRQLLIEGGLLALLGGAIGVLVAVWSARLLTSLAPESLPVLHDFTAGVDARVLGLAALATMGSVVVFGLAPALLGASSRAVGTVREATRGGTDSRARRRLRSSLVAAEFALSLILLIGAGLLVRSLARLRDVDTGVRGDGVVTASIALPAVRYPKTIDVTIFHDRLLTELRSMPGVEQVSTSVGLPPDVFGSSSDFFVTKNPPAEGAFSPLADVLTIDGGYFDALRIPLLAGRTFEPRDDEKAPNLVIISEALARKYFPHASPVGERLNIGGTGDDNAYTIVGVVGNVRYDGVAQDPSEAMYLPFSQSNANFIRTFSVVIRTAGHMDVTSSLRAAVKRVDSELAIAHVRTVDELVEASLANDRFRTLLLGLFALLALALAAVGIYGVMAYAVGRRAREIGIRLALGARDAQIYRLILREGLVVAGVGVVIGLTASLALTRVVTKLLYGVSATDAATFVGVPLILLGIAMLACIVPARRAARVDPSVTMRGD